MGFKGTMEEKSASVRSLDSILEQVLNAKRAKKKKKYL
jgi:hypothetical protein